MGGYNGDEAQQQVGNVAVTHGGGQRTLSRLKTLLPRLLTLVLCTLTLAFLVTAKQSRRIVNLEVKAKWSDARAFISLAVLSAICLAYSLLQTIISLFSFRTSGAAISRTKALQPWITFVADQLLTYALVSTAAASAGVAFIAKKGMTTAGWSEVCTTFDTFCDRVGLALVLSFFAAVALAISTLMSGYNATVLHLGAARKC